MSLPSVLYVVGTPIGNLSDLSPRALEVLSGVDFIAAEDTRITLRMLNHFGIKKPLISYYEHNLREKGAQIVERIISGESCAVVTDAGMPCISDPGEDLVRLCAESGIETVVVPGPSAAISALCLSGLSTSRFAFEGFLSMNKRSRAKRLSEIKSLPHTLIFYEAPHKLPSTLQDLLGALGNRQITLARELTKIHEQVWRTTLQEAANYYAINTPKGEFVLIIEGAAPEPPPCPTLEDAVKLAKDLVTQGQSASSAAKEAAAQTGCKKGEIYNGLLQK